MYKFYFIWFNIHFGCLSLQPDFSADVAKLADALDLGSSALGVWVRLPPSALSPIDPLGLWDFVFY
jgi:hypothetical protein